MLPSKMPLILLENRVWRTYQGGHLLGQFHGRPDDPDTNLPEDWLASVVAARNPDEVARLDEGLSCFLADGQPMRLTDAIQSDPAGMLGQSTLDTCGTSTGVLCKLLDAAERLTVQVHPTREKARQYFGSPFGKTEAWHILRTRTDREAPSVLLGFQEGITREAWEAAFAAQDIPAMLHMMHRLPVKPGDTVLVEAGVPHAIGAGCFLLEIQEPTDFTLRTERITPAGLPVPDSLIHQGIGLSAMMDCFTYEGVSEAEARRRWLLSPQPHGAAECLIPPERTGCFSLYRLCADVPLTVDTNGTFCIAVVTAGSGTLTADAPHALAQGTCLFLPAGLSRFTLAGEGLSVLLGFGPGCKQPPTITKQT